jgi:hypothetical protein
MYKYNFISVIYTFTDVCFVSICSTNGLWHAVFQDTHSIDSITLTERSVQQKYIPFRLFAAT